MANKAGEPKLPHRQQQHQALGPFWGPCSEISTAAQENFPLDA